jgi:hypothetical protein
MEVILAEICHYCGYQIDAELDGQQIEALADTLYKKLQLMKVRAAIPNFSDDWSKEAWKFHQ